MLLTTPEPIMNYTCMYTVLLKPAKSTMTQPPKHKNVISEGARTEMRSHDLLNEGHCFAGSVVHTSTQTVTAMKRNLLQCLEGVAKTLNQQPNSALHCLQCGCYGGCRRVCG